MSEIEHGHKITTESFYEGKLTSTKREFEESVFSSKEAILKDTIEALALISSGKTRLLNIEVWIDSKGQYRLKKRWLI